MVWWQWILSWILTLGVLGLAAGVFRWLFLIPEIIREYKRIDREDKLRRQVRQAIPRDDGFPQSQ